MLGADVRRVERMAQRGEIPCQKVGGQFRFNRAQITEWLQRTVGGMSDKHLAGFDAGMTEQRQQGEDDVVITPLLCPEAVTKTPKWTRKTVRRKNTVEVMRFIGWIVSGGRSASCQLMTDLTTSPATSVRRKLRPSGK